MEKCPSELNGDLLLKILPKFLQKCYCALSVIVHKVLMTVGL